MGASLRIVTPNFELMTPPSQFEDMAILVEAAGRTSHKSEGRIEPGSAAKFIPKIAFKLGHESIVEHASVSVRFICSRAMSHQLVRHRIAAYTQESQRYCDYSNEDKFAALSIIVPPSILGNPKKTNTANPEWRNMNGMRIVRADHNDSKGVLCYKRDDPKYDTNPLPIYTDLDGGVAYAYFNALMTCYETYLFLREKDIPAEDARFVLPNANKTEVASTFNLRQWRHVFKLRCDKHAQWEIRMLMLEVLDVFLDSPLSVFFEDLRWMLADKPVYVS